MRLPHSSARSRTLVRVVTHFFGCLGLLATLLFGSWSHAQSPKATTAYGYDELNRITSVTTAAGTVNITYDRTSLPVEVRYPNGVITRMAYDGAKRMKSVATLKVSGAVEVELEKTTYTFDLNGNRASQTRVVSASGSVSAETETTTYTYDLDDRLVGLNLSRAVGGTTVTQSLVWELDRSGNRLKESSTGSQPELNWLKVYAYDVRDRITRIDTLGTGTGFNSAGSTIFDYDPNGNLTQKTRGATQRTFIWNARDRLVEVREGSLLLGRYKYNAEGFRDEIEGERRTTWVGGFAYLDKDMANGFLARYEAGPNGRSPLMVATPNGIEYLHADSLGSTTLATDPSGASKAATRFDAFGNAETQGSTRNKFGFTGHEPDKSTGLIYFKARHYDPELGRFISADPYEGEPGIPLSWNGYLYANGNPLYYVDRNGYEASDGLEGAVESYVNLLKSSYEMMPGIGSYSTAKDMYDILRGKERTTTQLKVDLKKLTVSAESFKAPTVTESLTGIVTGPGKLLGQTLGATSVATDGDMSKAARDQAHRDLGSGAVEAASMFVGGSGAFVKPSTKQRQTFSTSADLRDSTNGAVLITEGPKLTQQVVPLASGAAAKSDPSLPSVVYRELSEADRRALDEGKPISPKGSGGTILDHVRGKPTGHISASESVDGTIRFESGNGLVEIDVSKAEAAGAKIIPHKKVIEGVGPRPKQVQKVMESKEVLIEGNIPPDAVKLVPRR